jgi:protein-tyrosine-phosphatase
VDDDVRWVLTKGKLPTSTWIDVVSTAHRVGLRSSSTMMYGHVDHPRHWVKHLRVIAGIQDETGGFTEFVPLPFVHNSSPIYLAGVARPGPTARDNLAVHAMARIMLHGRIDNIQTSWVKLGVDGTRRMLRAGDGEVKPLGVLFLCTGNSARSILAEGYLNSAGRGRFQAYSAGSHPGGKVNPFALQLLAKNRIGTTELRSKSWDEFAAPGAPEIDLIFTVCDSAAGEACPIWPGKPISAHWGVADPAQATGSDEQKRRAFRRAYAELSARIDLLIALPIEKLDRQSLKSRLDEIGNRNDSGVRKR